MTQKKEKKIEMEVTEINDGKRDKKCREIL